MWGLGHLGIGSKIAQPFAKKLPYRWLLLGTLLPDLIDKPLYYGASLITGKTAGEIGLLSCTRTVGHTALFLCFVTGTALVRKSKILGAIALGISTHLLLDGVQDQWLAEMNHTAGESSLLVAFFFPFYLGEFKLRFSEMPYHSLSEHLKSGTQPLLFSAEALGAIILGWDYLRFIRVANHPRKNP